LLKEEPIQEWLTIFSEVAGKPVAREFQRSTVSEPTRDFRRLSSLNALIALPPGPAFVVAMQMQTIKFERARAASANPHRCFDQKSDREARTELSTTVADSEIDRVAGRQRREGQCYSPPLPGCTVG